MPPTPESCVCVAEQMPVNNTAWEQCDLQFAAWKKKLFNEDVFREIGTLIVKHRGGPAEELLPPRKGSFNVMLRMRFLDGGSAIIRFPAPGSSVFTEEKYGMSDESPAGLGPLIIMEYLENDADFVDALNTPGLSGDDRPILDPHVSGDRLVSVYKDMAGLLLHLSRKSFHEIGCITNNETDEFDDNWIVPHRPLTLNMNELAQLGDVPLQLLPQGTFTTASSYFLALAELHMTHLSSQKQDAISSKEDARHKYLARCLFRILAREKRLTQSENENGPFKLICDDLRPANVLANSEFNYKIAGAIDWEFSYAAPVEFTYSPPWWLLLERPEYWAGGLDAWEAEYEKRLGVFLSAMEDREDDLIQRKVFSEEERLSNRMEEGWRNGDFWVCYAATRSWAFDMVYWGRRDRGAIGAAEGGRAGGDGEVCGGLS